MRDEYAHLDQKYTAEDGMLAWFRRKTKLSSPYLHHILITGRRQKDEIKFKLAEILAANSDVEPATNPAWWVKLPVDKRKAAFYIHLKDRFNQERKPKGDEEWQS